MIEYAEILHGRVRYLGNAPKLPEFSGALSVVDITNFVIKPEVGWRYDGTTFIPDTVPERQIDPDITTAQAIARDTRPTLTPEQTSTALKLLLKKFYGG